jgi:carbon-monoxide dehydrogenase large subunit
VRTDADQIDVVIGTQSSGQGHETSFAQVIESWLGVPAKDVNIVTGDSDIVLEGGGSHRPLDPARRIRDGASLRTDHR